MLSRIAKEAKEIIADHRLLEKFENPLLDYHIKAVEWMLIREQNEELPPFWKRSRNGFVNVVSGKLSKEQPSRFRGGIFNDCKALNMIKPLCCLMLMDNKHHNKKEDRKPTLLLHDSTLHDLLECLESSRPKGLRIHYFVEKSEFKSVDLRKIHLVVVSYQHLNKLLTKIKWRRVIFADVDLNGPDLSQRSLHQFQGDMRWVVPRKKVNLNFHLRDLSLSLLNLDPFNMQSDDRLQRTIVENEEVL